MNKIEKEEQVIDGLGFRVWLERGTVEFYLDIGDALISPAFKGVTEFKPTEEYVKVAEDFLENGVMGLAVKRLVTREEYLAADEDR